MGICHYYSEQPDQALTCFARARELNPEFGLAREWTARILAERARSAAGAPPPLAHVPTAAPAPTDPPRPS
jgi:hypothetical protein